MCLEKDHNIFLFVLNFKKYDQILLFSDKIICYLLSIVDIEK